MLLGLPFPPWAFPGKDKRQLWPRDPFWSPQQTWAVWGQFGVFLITYDNVAYNAKFIGHKRAEPWTFVIFLL